MDTHSGSLSNKLVKAFLSVGHDEYWSPEMRTKVEAARDRTNNPVNLIFMAGNECYWRIHFGQDLRSFTCDKNDYGSGYYDWWRSGDAQNPEASLMGIEYFYNSLWGSNVVVTNISGHWAFNHTTIATNGSQTLPGLLGYEVDGCWDGVACNFIAGAQLSTNTTKLADSTFTVDDCTNSMGHSYMTIYTATNGPTNVVLRAQVFATGSMYWNFGLDEFGYAAKAHDPTNRVNSVARQMTHNVIRKFTGNSTSPLP